jgi:hypothetical protein
MKMSTIPSDSHLETVLPGDAAANPHRPSGNLAARIYFGLVATIGTAAIAAGMTVATTNSGWASLVSILGETVFYGDFLVALLGFALVLQPKPDDRTLRCIWLGSLVILLVGVGHSRALADSANPAGELGATSVLLGFIVMWIVVSQIGRAGGEPPDATAVPGSHGRPMLWRRSLEYSSRCRLAA